MISAALVAIADATGLSVLATRSHADAALFVLALTGLLVGRRLSPRSRPAARWSDEDA